MQSRGLFLLYSLALLVVGTASVGHLVSEARQKRLDRQLITAVQSNDTLTVTALLDQGANANAHRNPSAAEFSFWQILRDPFRRKSLPVSQDASALQIAVGVDAHNNITSFLQDAKYWMMMESGGACQYIGKGENVGVLIALLQHGATWPQHEKYTMKAEANNYENKAFWINFQMIPTQSDAATRLYLAPSRTYLEQPATRQQYIAFRRATKLGRK